MRELFACAAGAALMAGAPLAAQENKAAEEAEAMAAVMQVFAAEPLSAEQKARLPLARSVVDQVMPEGTMKEMMGSMFDGILGPIMNLAESAGPELADYIGYDNSEFDLNDEQAAEITAIVDPEWKERSRREMAMMQEMMGQLMIAMEPSMRRGMSEAYAVHFTVPELEGIKAFFATEIGASYARKSYKLASDPRIMSAALSELPQMMELFAETGKEMEAATADLPARKTFDTLEDAERARIIEITGLSVDDLRAGMEVAAENDAAGAPF